jgi:chromosome segregation ATPase
LSSVSSQLIQAAVSIIKDFASRFTHLEAENVQLQQAAQSKSAQLDQTVKMAATARQEAGSLKKELNQLKTMLKEEDKEKAEAQIQVKEKEDNIQAKEKEDNLRNSIKALLGNLW